MRIKLDLHGVRFEYEKAPMPERRFRAVCLLAAGMYVGMMVGITSLCGVFGVVAVAVVTLLIAGISNI